MRVLILAIAIGAGFGFHSASAEELFDAEAANALFNNGLKLYFQGNYSGAIDLFEESIQVNPENAKAHYFIGYSHYKEGDFSRASEAFSTAYGMDKTYSPVSP
jgi:tetratricopeptide (TPR) repeat protein